MPDHLRLPEPHRLATRRRPPAPRGGIEVDRARHATTLAGVLAGLGLPYPGAIEEPPEDEEERDSRLVLVFTKKGPLKEGPFRKWHMVPVAEGSNNTYMVISDAESRRLFAHLVETYGGGPGDWTDPKAWQKQLDAIDGVRVYSREDRADERLRELNLSPIDVVDILIWPSTLETRAQRERVARERLAEVAERVERASGEDGSTRVVATDPRPDSTMVRVIVDSALLDALLEHPLVERIRPPLRPEVTLGDLVSAPRPDTVPAPQGAPIGVIDDLVTENALLDGVVQARASIPEGSDFGPATPHGTHVAGIAAYGELRSFVTAPSDGLPTPHPIFAARVMEQDPHDPQRATLPGLFHEQMEAAIRWLHGQGVRVITCSITNDGPDSTPTPSETMATLDRLIRELGVVIVMASGNVTSVDQYHWRDDYPKYLDRPEARVADPAGAALVLTVGARAQHDAPSLPPFGPSARVAIAAAGQASPFTRTGPARGRAAAGTAKPEFVAHGGNYAWDDQIGRAVGRDPNTSVITLAPAGSMGGRVLAVDDGTSLAAPFVAHQVASIATRYPGASANLLRALTALSGDRHTPDREAEAVLSAYGVPVAARVLESGTHRVVVVYEGVIGASSTVVHEIPIPEQFATGAYKQRIRIALAFDPPVRRSRRDYIAGEMAFDFIRNLPFAEVEATYSEQPTEAEADEDPTRVRRPMPLRGSHVRPALEPGSQQLMSNTLVCRSFQGGWDPDDDGYFVVVKHQARPWANAEEKADQPYAIAVELSLSSAARIDLLAQVRAQLRQRIRLRNEQ